MRNQRTICLAILIIAAFTLTSNAVIRNVPSQYPTIQAGINAAINGDTVLVADGIYTGTGNKNLDFLGKAIVVKSSGGAENCVIDCQNSGRGFYFHLNETNSSILEGIKITNGLVNDFGGGIYLNTSSPTIKDCIIKNNSTNDPGPSDAGGGIACFNANPYVISTDINENTSPQGAAIYCSGANPIFTNCEVKLNTTSAQSVIRMDYNSNITFTDCVISNNTCPAYGVIGIYSGSALLTNCTVSYNTCTNHAITGGTTTSKNSIFSHNTSNVGVVDCNYYAPNISYSDFFGNTGSNFFGSLVPAGLGTISTTNLNGDPCDQYHNIFLDPQFYSTTGDSAFYLTANSPCIDAGDPASPLDPDSTIADMGAYYFDQTPVLYIIPEFLDFELVEVGEAEFASVYIINPGIDNINIDNLLNYLSVFTFDSTIIGAVVPAEDSLELEITFTPDSSTAYIDTLFIISGEIILTLPLSGGGLGAYIALSDDTLDFGVWEPNTPYPARNFSFSNQGNDDLLVMNITALNPSFLVTASPWYILNPGESSNPVTVTFHPLTEGFNQGYINLPANAYNTANDTAYIYISGMWEFTPAPVQGLTIDITGPDAVLNWLPVDTSIYGNPIETDAYLIYYSELPYNPDSLFFFHGLSFDTTYIHQYAAQFSENMFYFVEAYLGEVGMLNDAIASGQILNREEVCRMIRNNTKY